jgi:regulator of protease activity HflC (stomatin/prohibitin superfamily)
MAILAEHFIFCARKIRQIQNYREDYSWISESHAETSAFQVLGERLCRGLRCPAQGAIFSQRTDVQGVGVQMGVDELIGGNAVFLAIAVFIILSIFLGVRIVPQSEKHVVERFGRLRSVLGPGINFVVPFLDRVAHRISILERQLPTASQDAITADNVLVKVETSVFYRITEPEKTVYRIRDVDAAIATTVAGIVRSEIGKLELDQVQSNRSQLIERVREQVRAMVDDWGVEVTRAEILDVNLDEATRAAMLQQLNAERARRAQVMEAEGRKRSVELAADADLYAAEQAAKAKRVTADAEAYATSAIAVAIKESGLEAAQYQLALAQVDALSKVAQGNGKQTILVPAQALDAFADAFKMLKGRG